MFDRKGTAVFVLSAAILYILIWQRKEQEESLVSDQLEESYDYIIIGGGSAGSVLAVRLSEDIQSKVLLLEAGGHYSQKPMTFVPAFALATLHTDADWDFRSLPETNVFLGLENQQTIMSNGKILGGSGSITALMYCRGNPDDFNEWETKYNCKGWGYQKILPYFKKSEDVQIPDLKTSKYHGTGGPIAVSEIPEITPLADYFLKAGEEIGYKKTDYNGDTQTGFSKTQITVRNGVRSSTAIEYLGKTGKRQNLDISINSLATKIDIENKVAKGVYFVKDNRKRYVKARKRIIVSAGALNSPKILMLSGIGPKEHLTDLGIPVLADLPVGLKTKDHITVCLNVKIDKPISLTRERLLSVWTQLQYAVFGTGPLSYNMFEVSAFLHSDKSKLGKARPDIQLTFSSTILTDKAFTNYNSSVADELIEPYTTTGHGFSVAITLLRPRSTGTVQLQSNDPFDDPLINTQSLSDKKDLEDLLAGIRIFEEIMATEAMKNLGADISINTASFCSQHKFSSDEFWRCMIRHIGFNFYHATSTCKMGPKHDKTSVVDLELRVQGIHGLHVCDASVFPTITSGNTNAPVIAVAERAADIIRGM